MKKIFLFLLVLMCSVGFAYRDRYDFSMPRGLPKTGQTVSYVSGDDGDLEKGWSVASRFIEQNLSGDDVVIDQATGLMWAKSASATINNSGSGDPNWAHAIAYPLDKTFGGFSDWRIPNIIELISILNYGASSGVYSVFTGLTGKVYWSSTTSTTDSGAALELILGAGSNYYFPSTKDGLDEYIFCCRSIRDVN